MRRRANETSSKQTSGGGVLQNSGMGRAPSKKATQMARGINGTPGDEQRPQYSSAEDSQVQGRKESGRGAGQRSMQEGW